MCLYTKYIMNPKYKPSKKNGGHPPECTDERLRYIPAKCGRCIECRKQKKSEWIMRLSEEVRNDSSCQFVTLTFNDEAFGILRKKMHIWSVEPSNEELHQMVTYAVRRFLENIRHETGKSVKHWLITEKGEDFGRIHLHGIIWGKHLDKWKWGYTYAGKFVNEQTILYITKYMLKIPEKDRSFVGKVFASPGIGRGYLTKAKRNAFKGEETDQTYITRKGSKIALPQYFRRKLYTDEQREKLWIDAQERGYRYICGEKVSTENLEEWENLTEYYQKRAKKLYGEDPEEWDREKQKKRLAKMRQYLRKRARERHAHDTEDDILGDP
ncbi:MAG: putative replication initiation protein [Microviridae sp.]|nr:MAG: putative replication initiation protein [Microviridae sp.]